MPATKDCLFEYQNISFNKTIERLKILLRDCTFWLIMVMDKCSKLNRNSNKNFENFIHNLLSKTYIHVSNVFLR